MRVYVHGAGRTGISAWPHASPQDAIFLDNAPATPIATTVDALTLATPPGAIVLLTP